LDGEEFYAHKIILSSRSPILNDYFLGNPKTDAGGWNILDNEDFIRIGRIDRELFGIILEYMYSGKIANSVFKVRERKGILNEGVVKGVFELLTAFFRKFFEL